MSSTSTGKASLIFNLVLQEIKARRSVGLIDVHGDLTEELERAISPFVVLGEGGEVVLLGPHITPFSLNPFEANDENLAMEKGLTLDQIPLLLTDRAFKEELVEGVEDEMVKDYFQFRFEPLPKKKRSGSKVS